MGNTTTTVGNMNASENSNIAPQIGFSSVSGHNHNNNNHNYNNKDRKGSNDNNNNGNNYHPNGQNRNNSSNNTRSKPVIVNGYANIGNGNNKNKDENKEDQEINAATWHAVRFWQRRCWTAGARDIANKKLDEKLVADWRKFEKWQSGLHELKITDFSLVIATFKLALEEIEDNEKMTLDDCLFNVQFQVQSKNELCGTAEVWEKRWLEKNE